MCLIKSVKKTVESTGVRLKEESEVILLTSQSQVCVSPLVYTANQFAFHSFIRIFVTYLFVKRNIDLHSLSSH